MWNTEEKELLNSLSVKKAEEVVLTKDELKKLNAIDKEGNTLLHKAAAFNEINAVDLFIHYGVDVNVINPKTKQKPIDILWENGFYEPFLLLLQADSTFPQDFSLESFLQDSQVPENLKRFVEGRETLHQWIIDNEVEKIDNFVCKKKLSKYFNSSNSSGLEVAAKHGTSDALALLLGVPLSSFPGKQFTTDQLTFLNYICHDGNSLLSVAAQCGNEANIHFLIKCGADVDWKNRAGKCAVDLAWANKHYNVVLQLLEADSNLPDGFDLRHLHDETKSQRELKIFVENRDKFHLAITEGNYCQVESYFTESKPSMFYLNSKSNSALFTAIKNKQFKIYAFLKLFGANFKDEIERNSIESGLSIDEKESLKKALVPYFSSCEKSFLFYLISKSRTQKYFNKFEEIIKVLYEKLSQIPEILDILQVVQYADYLDIIFDFENENIKDINPTASSCTKGTTDYKEGRLYIAGKMEDSKLLGTLAHELAHLAMQILYNNECNPYNSSNNKNENKFKEICDLIKNSNSVRETLERLKNDSEIADCPNLILSRTYRYPEDEQASELIVRIPQILVEFGEEAGKLYFQHEGALLRLLQFFNQEVSPDSRKYIYDSFLIKPRNIVRILNESIGNINTIMEANIHFKYFRDHCNVLRNDSERRIAVVSSKNTWLSLLNLYEALTNIPKYFTHESYLVFKYSKYLKHSEEVNKAFYSEASDLLILQCPKESNFYSLFEQFNEWMCLLKGKKEKRIIFIVAEEKEEEFERILHEAGLNNLYSKHKDGDYSLNDLIYQVQENLLNSKLTFQGCKIILNQLVDKNEKSRKLVRGDNLAKLTKNVELKIGADLPVSRGYDQSYYTERFFNSRIEIKNKILKPEENISDAIVHNEKEFNTLSESKPDGNIHWLNNDKRILVWQKSQGSISTLLKYRIQRKNISSDILKEHFIPEDELIKHGRENKLLIISDTAGMGKSTVLTSLSSKVKTDKRSSWVLRVDLNRHTNLLRQELRNRKRKKASFTQKDAITFFIDKMLEFEINPDPKKDLERQLLKYHLKHLNSVILFLDGFDEISPDYNEIVIDMIENLKPFLNQVWITTRPYLREEIEGALGMFAYTLKPLASQEQIHFLTKFWQKCNPNFSNKQRIEYYAKALIDLLSQSINDREREFTGVPLQLRMVAEVFLKKEQFSQLFDEILEDIGEDIKPIKEGFQEFYISSNEKPHFPEKINFMSIYKLFIYKKYFDVYETEKKMSILSNLPTKKDIKKSFEIFIKEHEMLSLYSVFGPEEWEILLCEKERKTVTCLMEDIIVGEEKRGFVDEIIQNQPHFIHQTFAEYFAADFIFHEIVSQLQTEQVQMLFFKKILLNSSYKVIRAFLNEKLEKELPKEILEHYGNSFNSYWKSDPKSLSYSDKTILHISVEEGNTNIVDFLLAILTAYPKSLQSLLHSKDSTGRLPFFTAVFFNKLDVAKKLLIKGFDVNTKNTRGETALHVAVRDGSTPLVEWLITARENGGVGADVNARDHNNFTVLHDAVDKKNLEIVKLLMNHGSCVNAVNNDNYSILHNAIHSKIAFQVVKLLVENGADIGVKDEDGNSPLHYAAYQGKLDVAKYLIDHGANVHDKTYDDSTLLHEAACSGNKEFCEWLIEQHNLDVNAQDKNGRRPVHEAAQKDHLEIVKLLLLHQSDVYSVDNYGNSVLVEASKYGSPFLFEWLVNTCKLDLSVRNKEGRTLLHESVKYSNLELVKWLLINGFDPKVKDNNGNIILTEIAKYQDLFSSKSHREVKFEDTLWKKYALFNNAYFNKDPYYPDEIDIPIIRILVKYGANIDGHDGNGKTIFHYAAERGLYGIVKWLISPKENDGGGANVTIKDSNGETPLELAVKVGDEFMIDLIKQHPQSSLIHSSKNSFIFFLSVFVCFVSVCVYFYLGNF